MRSFRNKEIQQITIFNFLLSTIMILVGFAISIWAGIIVMITVFLLCTTFYIFTIKRYKNLSQLSEYLRQISSGNYSLDIRDNAEGELSILKSEIYKVTLMLTEYNEQLQREKLLLSDQMAEISHQLKTPLTSMMVMVDLLQDETTSVEKRREFTSILNSQLERIEWLVASLLKMAKLDAGVVEMKKERICAAQLIDHVLQPFLVTMEIKEITYSKKVDNSHIILCDFHWTSEALINIIKNCIEHTPCGGHISISFQDNPLYYEVLITDNGKGISKEDLPHIFTRFYRGKNASSDSVGIGLAMSYRIIRSQEGDIQVKSKPGEGSIFSIRLYKSIV
ncbi:MAG: HAMP domain-containing histidine kinase [Clostridiales bacterium]|nr:HAMP domain-containing histidine kinase [Clostridiales bacterium]